MSGRLPSIGWREFALEPRHYGIDRLSNRAEDLDDRFLMQNGIGRVIEHYADGERAVTCDIRLWPRHDDIRDAAYVRVVFQGCPVEDFNLAMGNNATLGEELEFELRGDDGSRMYYPMFVGVRESSKHPEPMPGRRIPSLVRLELIEHPLMLATNELTHLSAFELSRRVRNGEGNLRRFRLGRLSVEVRQGQLPRNVVQRGAEVMKAITDPQTPLLQREVGLDRIEVYLRNLRLVMAPDSVRLTAEHELHMRVERIQMLKRVVSLGPSAREHRFHEATTSRESA